MVQGLLGLGQVCSLRFIPWGNKLRVQVGLGVETTPNSQPPRSQKIQRVYFKGVPPTGHQPDQIMEEVGQIYRDSPG